MREVTIFFVLKGLLDGDDGVPAFRSHAGGVYKDGWYAIADGEDEPINADAPGVSRDEAKRLKAEFEFNEFVVDSVRRMIDELPTAPPSVVVLDYIIKAVRDQYI